MSFLSPLLFLGLAAIAVPILVHLIQRERNRVIEFPSLMFLQRIPYQSVRRRRIRHWFLLAMRVAAIALIVSAFARPFFTAGAAAGAVASGGSREVVILLDQSASMGYGDHWPQAQAAARAAIAELGPTDRASLVLFGRNAEEHLRSTSDRGRLEAAVETAGVTSGATRYGPALELAESILSQSTLSRPEVILISDFQKSGWTGSEEVRLGEQVRLTTVPIGSDAPANLSVPSVAFARAESAGQERVTVTAGVSNRTSETAAGVPVSLEIDGHVVETKAANVAAGASASVVFAPISLAGSPVRGAVRAGADALASDNTFHFVVGPSQPVSVLVIESGDRATSSFYLTRALAIGASPAFRVEVLPAGRVTAAALDGRAVVILNDTIVPPGLGVNGLQQHVERGGGLLVAVGQRTTWPANDTALLPGRLGSVIDRSSGRGGAIGYLDYGHPALEVFKAPRSGDFTGARILRYRPVEPGPTDRVLVRFDDGAPAAVERRVGEGRVIAWTTSLDDSWTDLVLKPVYLPLVHQLARYLASYEAPAPWQTVGQVVDVSALLKSRADRIAVTPSGEQIRIAASEPGLVELVEQGIYEIRAAESGAPTSHRLAVNLDPVESDLTRLDPQELVAAVTGSAVTATTAEEVSPEQSAGEAERQQGLWWFLLLGGLCLLAAEMAVSNRLSRTEKFL
jgi:hypothetical protein